MKTFFSSGQVFLFFFLAILISGCQRPNQFLEKVPPPARIEKETPMQSPPAQNRISGRVIDSATNEILIDAKIEIVNAANRALIGWARTDAQGNYFVSDLIAGSYIIRVSMPGYENFETSSAKELSSGVHWAQDAALNQTLNSVSGKISDAISGFAVEGAQVQLINALTQNVFKTVASERNGSYSFSRVPAGHYKLLVTKLGYEDLPSGSPGKIQGGVTATANFSLNPKKIILSGFASDSETHAALAGVEIKVLSQNGSLAASTLTGADGKYVISSLYSGNYHLSATLAGYDKFTTAAPGSAVGGNAYVVDAAMNSRKNTVYGSVVSALNGAGLSGARVQLLDATSGVVLSAMDTDSNGQYRMEFVPQGNYRMVFSKSGFTEYTTAQPGALTNGQLVQVNASLSPTLVPGQFRIVLTWTGQKAGAVKDVDSYLLIPNFPRRPIYFSDKAFGGANLDIDDTDWQGPETITIDTSFAGVYHYYIVNFDSPESSSALGNSEAIVTVYGDRGLLKQYRLDPGGQGIVYELFTIENGNIRDVQNYNSEYPYKTKLGKFNF